MNTTSSIDDTTIINGILHNNMKCYRLFQSRYFTYIKHLFSRWINDASDAEELSCDVMMKVINTIDRFDAAKGNMRLWIYVIAINTRNDYLRKLAAREKEAKVVSLDEPVTTGSDMLRIDFLVDTSSDGSELSSSSAYTSDPGLQAAQEIIKGLSADTRYILQMHADGYTSSEIAETVHKPEGTIRSICSRIKKAIRAAYEKVMNSKEHEASVTERLALSRCTEHAEVAVEASRSAAQCVCNDVPAADNAVITTNAEPADECDVNAASWRTRAHEPLLYEVWAYYATVLIRKLLSYFGALFKRPHGHFNPSRALASAL
ncbi:MAG: RNA polymerase sigma factor [Spirochaetes bacterium]|nr:RNA polymerase sigma factor [Spirochaetota bacterium]